MTIHEKIKEEIPEALKVKDEVRLRTLRSLLTAITNELVATKHKPDEILDDATALKVIKRAANQHKDSIQQFEKGGRPDLVSAEKEELEIIQAYLPEAIPKEKIKEVAQLKKEELGITDKAKMGMLVGAIMKELQGEADGNDVKEVVEKLFTE